MAETDRLTAKFDDFHAFEQALHALQQGRFARYEAFGPTSLADIEDLMPRKGSPVRTWTTVGAVTGLLMFFFMCVTTAMIYALIVGGKPPLSNVPYVVITYEGTILVGGIAAMLAVIYYAVLRPTELPEDYDPSFSSDTYGIRVECGADECERVRDLLANSGAVEVYENSK